LTYIAEYVAFVRGFSPTARLYLWSSGLTALAQGVTGVVMNLYLVRMGLGESFLGALASYSSLAAALFALPAGRASDRYGRRLALLASGVVGVAATVAQVVRPVAGVLVPATFIAGATFAVAMVSGGPLLVEASGDRDRTHLFGFHSALTLGLMVVGNSTGGYLPKFFGALYGVRTDAAVALRATLYMGLALYLLALIPLLSMRETPRREATPQTVRVTAAGGRRRGPAWLALSDPDLVRKLLLPQALVALGAGLIVPLQNVFMDRYLRASPAQIGVVFGLTSAATGIGSLAAPLLARRLGKIRAVTTCQLASLPFMALMGVTSRFGLYSAASLVRSSLMNLAGPLISSFSLEVVRSGERATVSSLINMFWSLGWAVSAWAGGWVMQNVSYPLPYGLALIFYAPSILLFYHYFKNYEKESPARTGAQEATTSDTPSSIDSF
jgi:MFS family permease